MEEQSQELVSPIKRLKQMLPPSFLQSLDRNFKYFCAGIKNNLRQENYEIIGITGYPGCGKSQLAAVMGVLIDDKYTFKKNICFIPTAKGIEKIYLSLPMFSYLQIDEASRSIHKHKWYEKTQQKLITLYDTERENHFLCSALLMPRFNNFTENFRNFFIKYWINIIARGIAIVYRRDEDKDTKDPWNIDFNSKLKMKYWRGKRVFERTASDIVRMEQKTKNYWFYFEIPEIPPDVWDAYKELKAGSRVELRETEEVQDYESKTKRKKMAKWKRIIELKNNGLTNVETGVELDMGAEAIRRNLHQIEAYHKRKGAIDGMVLATTDPEGVINNTYNRSSSTKSVEVPAEFDKI